MAQSLHTRQPSRLLLRFAAALLFALAAGGAARAEQPDAYVVRIDGAVSEAYARAVQRRLDRARSQGVETVILELNTPGGTVEHSRELADYIFQLDDVTVIAYINTDAFSGGTMVALACEEIYIDAELGIMGDVAPVMPTGEIVGEKAQSPIRETMARYARARGYPEALVKAMVTKEVQVWRLQLRDEPEGTFTYVTDADLRGWGEEQRAEILEKKLIVPAGELLTMDAQKAVEYGFARQTVEDEQELFEVLALDPARVERLYLTGSERLLTFLDMFSPLLIVGGIILLFMEMSNPGFGLPGIAGLSCFAAFFLIKWTLNYAQMLEIVLFAAGVILLMVEVLLIPGFGVAGITGIVLIFVSLVLAFQQFTWPQSGAQLLTLEYNLLKVIGAFALSGVGVAILARYLPSVPMLRRMVHRSSLAAAHAGELVQTRTPGLAGMAGREGVALTALRPAGRAEFEDTLLDVVTEGEFVPKGERVKVLEVRGSRVVVAPVREE